jgi:hypothetical protein
MQSLSRYPAFRCFRTRSSAEQTLKESIIDWRSTDLDPLFGHLWELEMRVAPGESESINKVVNFRRVLFRSQFCHALLSQL